MEQTQIDKNGGILPILQVNRRIDSEKKKEKSVLFSLKYPYYFDDPRKRP